MVARDDPPPFNQPIGPTKPRGGATGAVVRNGVIAAEWGTPNRVDMTFSATKSYLASCVGLAIDRGLIDSVGRSGRGLRGRRLVREQPKPRRDLATPCCSRPASGPARCSASRTPSTTIAASIKPRRKAKKGEPRARCKRRARSGNTTMFASTPSRSPPCTFGANRWQASCAREIMVPIGADSGWQWQCVRERHRGHRRPSDAVGAGRRPLGRRIVDQHFRSRPLRPAHAGARRMGRSAHSL